MKVLHLIDSAGLYGAEMVLLNLATEQKTHGIEPILGSIGKPVLGKKDIELAAGKKGINVKIFRMKNGPNLLGAISIILFVKQNQVDLIHSHGYKANILMGLLPAHFRKIPHLVTLHGWTSIKKYSKMWFYEWIDAFYAKRADMVVVVSDAMRSHPRVLSLGLTPVVVHNGIPQIVSHEKNSSTTHNDSLNNFCKKSFTIGSIGRLSPTKGFDFLINAVANVIDSGYDISLVIIGEGSEKQRLEEIARTRNIDDKVFLTGYLNQASQYLNYFDVFVISSLTEGLPITLLETMQAGVPIIATRVGGIPEVLDNGRCGILVNPGDAHELAEAVTKLYDSPERKSQLCNAARERVNNEFSSKNMERGYRMLYERLLRHK